MNNSPGLQSGFSYTNDLEYGIIVLVKLLCRSVATNNLRREHNLSWRLAMDSLPLKPPSDKNRNEYHRQWRSQIINKTCQECNSSFQGVRRSKFCPSCKKIRQKRFRPQTFPICQYCGKQFGPVDHSNKQFCSQDCHYKARSLKTSPMKGKKYPHMQRAETTTCPSCGKAFRKIHDHKKRKQIYCSHACYLRERRVSHFEIRVMDLIELAGVPVERQVRRGKWTFDAAISNTPILIEADGAYWHSSKQVQERDERKNQWCEVHGYILIRIPELEFYDNPKKAIALAIQRWQEATGQMAVRR